LLAKVLHNFVLVWNVWRLTFPALRCFSIGNILGLFRERAAHQVISFRKSGHSVTLRNETAGRLSYGVFFG
jgi:hypothetical protein